MAGAAAAERATQERESELEEVKREAAAAMERESELKEVNREAAAAMEREQVRRVGGTWNREQQLFRGVFACVCVRWDLPSATYFPPNSRSKVLLASCLFH